ncbi:MAG: hypothetical protein JWQ27_2367 [Ferruginibacter sp.]|nr:hypothetical protein [Ferruginibacter sp.]
MRFYLLLLSFCLISVAKSQTYKDKKMNTEARVSSLLQAMTLEEKIDYIGGVDGFYIRGIERLGLPKIKMSDGPVGVRTYGKATAYPASILSAATWDTVLLKRLGVALAEDAKARGVHILLAPGVNIFRASQNGRNFEYLGEDPYLASRLAVNYITGVQSKGVVATVKHFAANNQEWDRHHVSSDMDERTLQEIYLPAFKAAVQEANVGAVMNSYNLVNGIHATQNPHLNIDILRNTWKFKGILMSDWESVYDGIAAAKNGLDLEMPSGKFMNKATLLPALNNGSLSQEITDEKIRRILRVIFEYGFYDNIQEDKTIPLDNGKHDKVALDLARGGIVLLKNTNNLLPLNRAKIKTIAVIGPNADSYITGGGSSQTSPFHAVSLLEGLKATAGKNVKITFVPAFRDVSNVAKHTVFYADESGNHKGLTAMYFNNMELKGPPVHTDTISTIDNEWQAAPGIAGLGADHFSIRYTGFVKAEKSGRYRFSVKGDDGYRLWIGDKLMIDSWHDQGATINSADLNLISGKSYPVKLEYYENGGSAVLSFAWFAADEDFKDALEAAAKADVAIISIGFNESLEHEGGDRSFELPSLQDSLVNAIAAVNQNTVVVLNAGGNVDMQSWLPHTKSLLQAWYPGQEGGTALAEIIFGITNPSGKLPASFEKQWADNPVFKNYHDTTGNKKVLYKEGLFVGYRYWDMAKVKPQFPFGFGLSFTRFAYSNISVVNKGSKGSPKVEVSFSIKNTGDADGAEIAQLYIHQLKCPVPRPFKELKGFTKVFLKKGGSKKVSLLLDAAAFSYYKNEAGFSYDPGNFEIIVGASSADLRLSQTILLQ